MFKILITFKLAGMDRAACHVEVDNRLRHRAASQPRVEENQRGRPLWTEGHSALLT